MAVLIVFCDFMGTQLLMSIADHNSVTRTHCAIHIEPIFR